MDEELELIRGLRPSIGEPDPAVLAREREALMAYVTRNPVTGQTRRRRWRLGGRRRLSLALALLLITLAGVAAGGWALTRGAAQATEVQCEFDRMSAQVIDSSSGDPVEDCRAEWRRLFASPPPALAAYDNGLGGITVVRAGRDVPAAWRLLSPEFRQDARLIELDAALGDVGAGLESRCLPLEQARPIAQAQLTRLGLEDWMVVSRRGEADGVTACTRHYLERARRRIVLIPLPTLTASDERASAPYVQLAARLRDATRTCVTVAAAVRIGRAEAVRLGLDETTGEVVFHLIDGDACARATTNVGGRIEVTIRGDR